MAKPFRERELVRILSLLGPRIWIYFLATLVSAVVLGFSFNLVLAFIQMDVMDAAVSGQQALLNRALILAGVTFVTGVPLLIGAQYVLALFEKKALSETRVKAFQQIVKSQWRAHKYFYFPRRCRHGFNDDWQMVAIQHLDFIVHVAISEKTADAVSGQKRIAEEDFRSVAEFAMQYATDIFRFGKHSAYL